MALIWWNEQSGKDCGWHLFRSRDDLRGIKDQLVPVRPSHD
jgi:hypothetical protein